MWHAKRLFTKSVIKAPRHASQGENESPRLQPDFLQQWGLCVLAHNLTRKAPAIKRYDKTLITVFEVILSKSKLPFELSDRKFGRNQHKLIIAARKSGVCLASRLP